MAAVRDQVVAAALAALAGVGAAELELMPSADPVSFPALAVFDTGQGVGERESNATRYALSLTVEGYVERAGGAAALAELNDLYAACVAALMAEPVLGGLAETIDEGDMRIVVAPLSDERRLAFSLDFLITFPARRDDPAQPA